jgi:ABC-type sugar transport system permease subunit
MKKKTRKAIFGYIFISIWLIGFAVFTFYPFLMSIVFSFSNVKFVGGEIESEKSAMELIFVGFDNFKNIFALESGFKFLTAIKNFVIELVLQVPIIIVFSILISLLLNQKIKCRGFFRMIFFLPVIIASGPVLKELIDGGAAGGSFIEEYGIIAMISDVLPGALAAPITALFEEIITVFWFSGVQIIIFLSALQKIDKSVYEAASIDGASPWDAFWKITLPSLTGMIVINSVYTIVTLATFSNNEVIGVISSAMGSVKAGEGYGFAAALAWVYMIIILLALGLVLLIFKGNDGNKKVVKANAKRVKKSR